MWLTKSDNFSHRPGHFWRQRPEMGHPAGVSMIKVFPERAQRSPYAYRQVDGVEQVARRPAITPVTPLFWQADSVSMRQPVGWLR